MSDDKKLPNLNLTPEELAELLKNIPIKDLLPPDKPKTSKVFHRCEQCRDTKMIDVYGGPNRPCPYCGPKY